MLSTDKQTNRQTDKQTNQRCQKHNLLCQGGNNKTFDHEKAFEAELDFIQDKVVNQK